MKCAKCPLFKAGTMKMIEEKAVLFLKIAGIARSNMRIKKAR